MTWKCAVADIPLAAARRVPVDPATLSVTEKERLVRGWVQNMWRNIGPRQDVPRRTSAHPQMMGWMMDEYSKLVDSTPRRDHRQAGGRGGSLGRTEATGFGVIYTVREAMKHLKLDPTNLWRHPGFGNVSQYAAIGFIEQLGARCLRVLLDRADKTPTRQPPQGVDPTSCSRSRPIRHDRQRQGHQGGYVIEDADAGSPKKRRADPRRAGRSVNAETVKRVSSRVRLVAEGATARPLRGRRSV